MIERKRIGSLRSSSGPWGTSASKNRRVAGRQHIGPVAVAIADLALQHVDELDALMLEQREDVGIRGQRDQIGLDRQGPAQRMAEQLVLMARRGCPGARY